MFGRLTVLTIAALYLSFTEAVSICNADSCLRQIKGTAPAWPYCSRYLTTTRPVITPVPATITVTATRTVFAVFSPSGKPVEYITRKGAPYIAPNKKKREVPEIEARGPSPMTGVPLAPRQALPTWASSCTGDPGRLSSACTCLLGYTAERSTSTRTVTQKTATATVSVCQATDPYFLRPDYRGDWVDRFAVLQHFGFPTTDIQECCNICFHTWNCIGYYVRREDDEISPGQCGIIRVESSSNPEPNDRQCSNGLMEVYDPYNGDFPGPWELGLCAYLVYSDE
ncbi:hypothetical protein AOL_s00043g131 [Orbilia oligospora ATCC 24927]|uniref:Apple domain-containing protein n=2 Tax=Orbilia oligospora TaxID=2813651 RepID=G1X358_ARTOA|nr:hypothetical protein AOL_s00043g131 [Orbilia oligospora ATCC 24927]EGX52342.1 hypothetical protein AOL_s00043g131 [Orbilia oligospora ATCC 24927]KAF3273675.1 hypothetical protein TWF970_008874 [Orbilia oligospora]